MSNEWAIQLSNGVPMQLSNGFPMPTIKERFRFKSLELGLRVKLRTTARARARAKARQDKTEQGKANKARHGTVRRQGKREGQNIKTRDTTTRQNKERDWTIGHGQ